MPEVTGFERRVALALEEARRALKNCDTGVNQGPVKVKVGVTLPRTECEPGVTLEFVVQLDCDDPTAGPSPSVAEPQQRRSKAITASGVQTLAAN